MHLNPYQDGCYRRLIDHYMKTRAPLPDNDSSLARIIGDSEANWVAMASPLVRPFFEAKNGRLYLKRCEQILDYQDDKTSKLSESGKKGAEKRWNKIKEMNSHPIATPMGSAIAQDRTGEVQKSIKKEEDPTGFCLPEWIDASDWKDFEEMRKKQRKPLTDRARGAIVKKLEAFAKLGHDPKTVIENSIRNSWQDVFEPKKETNGKPTRSDLADQAVQRALARLEVEETPTLIAYQTEL